MGWLHINKGRLKSMKKIVSLLVVFVVLVMTLGSVVSAYAASAGDVAGVMCNHPNVSGWRYENSGTHIRFCYSCGVVMERANHTWQYVSGGMYCTGCGYTAN